MYTQCTPEKIFCDRDLQRHCWLLSQESVILFLAAACDVSNYHSSTLFSGYQQVIDSGEAMVVATP